MPIREYLCPDGHRTERFYHSTEKVPDEIVCHEPGRKRAGRCLKMATLTMSTPAPILGANGLPRSTWKGKLCSEGGEK